MILAIDPGPIESAYVILDENLKPVEFGKENNHEFIQRIHDMRVRGWGEITDIVIEMVACYGMPVGKDVFETCIWIGRIAQEIYLSEKMPSLKYIYRKDEKLNLCGDSRAKDANIRQALINRFAKHDFKNGKGTKQNPDWFYGFKDDIWQAYAVGVTYYDLKERRESK